MACSAAFSALVLMLAASVAFTAANASASPLHSMEKVAPLVGSAHGGGPDALGDEPAPPYFWGPMWQDLRLLASFALGIVCMQMVEISRGAGSDADGEAPAYQKFEMYPYAL
mmetsp:Transcript_48892/g.139626  ORF Transcript_48892/g.139626 Transcript_48892/m.139626 type:complete len:112 (+) Transcript_48892:67-402(+)